MKNSIEQSRTTLKIMYSIWLSNSSICNRTTANDNHFNDSADSSNNKLTHWWDQRSKRIACSPSDYRRGSKEKLHWVSTS
jgi:hypothetical protein